MWDLIVADVCMSVRLYGVAATLYRNAHMFT